VVAYRAGQAGVADELRHRYSKGFLVALTIPNAYPGGAADVIAEVNAKENGHRNVDGYAYRIHRQTWANAHEGEMDTLWAQVRPATSKLPARYAEANAKQRAAIVSAVAANATAYNTMKDAIWRDMRDAVARTVVGNNRYIPDSAQSFAAAQRAVAGDSGTAVLGKAMIYHKAATDIPQKVNDTVTAVRATLAANAPVTAAPNQTTSDAEAARVRFLTISAHGGPGWMGGHGEAAGAAMRNRDVAGIVASMSASLASDVRVRLFSCHTARTMRDEEDEGTIADAFREELHAKGHSGGAVVGHTESGDTQKNSATRFLHTSAEDGRHDWRANAIFGDAYLREFMRERGVSTLTKQQLAKVRSHASAFFGRECWMEDLSNEEALRRSSRARWEARHTTKEQALRLTTTIP
jgi:hypothetical protein